MPILISIFSILFLSIILIFLYLDHNANAEERAKRKLFKKGFVEKQIRLSNGTVINYGEGPNNGPALLLIHGQGVDWKNYYTVLPELSKTFHIYAIDCHGHGKSSHNPDRYSGKKMGEDIIRFITTTIKEEVYVSGHSSGGLLTAWLAAHCSKVRAIVLEDPPFFSTEKSRTQSTFAWQDSFRLIHDFLQQDTEQDYLLYYLPRSYWKDKFGKLWSIIQRQAIKFRANEPDKIFRVPFLPPSLNRIWEVPSNTAYDKRFGEAFYDNSWFEDFDQEELLAQVRCPSTLIFAKSSKWKSHDENGILMAAMSTDDAQRAHELLPNNELITVDSGHGVHNEKPVEFIGIVRTAFLK
ncbi:alpha/beta fold hydrolase [Sphingobacterium lactis]|uniref:Pimeloyl-ACP methyl ester carboxylesterase n=1 Tax=Sphingobacterium lactis TaxID=797291 RepID=A0A1H5TU57_9SPHI|nr:alpha/beta hydrolase [Sphingobacterium lactis]SEF66299.1 Pimeloyl-ACP methyl ester carboxylesterase [Sphingobacterium lactis]